MKNTVMKILKGIYRFLAIIGHIFCPTCGKHRYIKEHSENNKD